MLVRISEIPGQRAHRSSTHEHPRERRAVHPAGADGSRWVLLAGARSCRSDRGRGPGTPGGASGSSNPSSVERGARDGVGPPSRERSWSPTVARSRSPTNRRRAAVVMELPGDHDERGRVLIVDDDPQILRAVRTSLQGHDYEVVTAGNGETALVPAARRGRRPDRPGPRPAGDRRPRGDPSGAILVRGADHRPVGPGRSGRQGRRVRGRRGRLRDETVRHAGAARQDASRPSTGGRGSDVPRRPVRPARSRSRTSAGQGRRQPDPPDAHGVPAPRGLRHEPRKPRPTGGCSSAWGPGYATEHQYLRVFIRQLRSKLADDPARPRFIVTEAGLGYRWKPDPDEDPSAVS